MEADDWRQASGFMPVSGKCCICKKDYRIGLEPRFLYAVCEEHSKLTPVEISALREIIKRNPNANY